MPSLTVSEVFAALLSGAANEFSYDDHCTFGDAPAGSMKIENGDWLYIITPTFAVEAHCFEIEENGSFLNVSGEWVVA